MKLSNRYKAILFFLLIVLNTILRFQVIPREIGLDSLEMHIMVNSLSEFGYAKWILDPLSIVGMYPASYPSGMHFLLSGIHQTTGIGMNSIIFIYTVLLGLFSIFSMYIMAGMFSKDDVFKFFAAFSFSTMLAVLNYSTWTIPTRGLLLILAPITFYYLLKLTERIKIKLIFLLIFFSLFLFTTHHLFYFLIPIYTGFFFGIVIFKTKLKNISSLKDKILSPNNIISKNLSALFILAGFAMMFSIPFITKKFIETSRYDPIIIGYARNIGIFSIFSIGGLFYLVFKDKRNIKEWCFLFSSMLLLVFIYKVTYMKWFLPLLAIIFICIGLFNVTETLQKRKYGMYILIFILLTSVCISGYYQFLKDNDQSRAMANSTYFTGNWIKDNIDKNYVSNDIVLGRRLFSVSETPYLFDMSDRIDTIYGFLTINISDYTRHPVTSDDFWLSGYKGPHRGSDNWHALHLGWHDPSRYNITYVAENSYTDGYIRWNHKSDLSEFLKLAYEQNCCLYHAGKIKIWEL